MPEIMIDAGKSEDDAVNSDDDEYNSKDDAVNSDTGVRDLDYTRLMKQGSTTNPLSWQGNVDYRKSALYYATLGRGFRNCFSFQNISLCIHKYGSIIRVATYQIHVIHGCFKNSYV